MASLATYSGRRIEEVKLIRLENYQAGKDLASILFPQLLGEPWELCSL